MSDRRVILSKVFGYGLLSWAIVLFLSSLPLEFAYGPNWSRVLAGAGLALVTGFGALVLVRYLRLVPTGWIIAVMVAMSALFAFVGVVELSSARTPRPFPDPAMTVPDYIRSAASALFVLANIVAIIVTLRAGTPRSDAGEARRRE